MGLTNVMVMGTLTTGDNMEHKDPLTGKTIMVQSVYRPTRTLLEGAIYARANHVLNGRQQLALPLKGESK